ncbi:MAG: hypothetical protein ABIV94_03730 [Acidimicrobiales bacterium]
MGREAPPSTVLPAAPLATRIGCALLEVVLFVAGLGVGWAIWWAALWHRGGSPARSLLHLELAGAHRGSSPGWRRTAVRELGAKLLVPLAPVSALIWLGGHRGLWDRITATAVVGPR